MKVRSSLVKTLEDDTTWPPDRQIMYLQKQSLVVSASLRLLWQDNTRIIGRVCVCVCTYVSSPNPTPFAPTCAFSSFFKLWLQALMKTGKYNKIIATTVTHLHTGSHSLACNRTLTQPTTKFFHMYVSTKNSWAWRWDSVKIHWCRWMQNSRWPAIPSLLNSHDFKTWLSRRSQNIFTRKILCTTYEREAVLLWPQHKASDTHLKTWLKDYFNCNAFSHSCEEHLNLFFQLFIGENHVLPNFFNLFIYFII